MVAFTANFRLAKPDFNTEGWDTQLNSDLDLLDSIIGQFNTGLTIQGVWLNATLYAAGVSVVDPSTGHVWIASATYTSSAAPLTFAQDRAAFPAIWTDITNPATSAAASAANALISANNAAASLTTLQGLFGGGSTGTGQLVLSTGPTITNPTFSGLGAITPTSVTTGAIVGTTISGTTGTFTGLITPASVAGVKGTTTNDNAQAGSIGEYMESNSGNNSTTCTITIANPAVITKTAHTLLGIAPVFFNTTGALPTGIVSGTTYWTIPSTIAANTFQIATSIANAIAGVAVITTGTQSGTQTCTEATVLSTGVNANVSALSLTAGDWDVTGNVSFNAGTGTTTTQLIATIFTTSATVPNGSGSGATATLSPTSAANAQNGLVAGVVRISISVTTTVYLICNAAFGVSSMTAFGHFRARRMR